MVCLRCDNTEFKETTIKSEQEIRGEMLVIEIPGVMCTMCGWESILIDQVSELRNRTADEYRRKHGLLTSGAIRAMREALNMTQAQFAEFTGVGEASVKRWETWLVQDRSMDELLRLKFKTVLND